MNLRPRLPQLLWMIFVLGACAFLIWAAASRIERVEHVTGLFQSDVTGDPASMTGYAGGTRELILPARSEASWGWIVQTQQMLARDEWRVRHVDYANAPFGMRVSETSPYRWWLGFVSWFDRQISGRPAGQSVERAVLYADVAMQIILLAALTGFAARFLGALPAVLLAAGLVFVFPLAGEFVPGLPDEHGMAIACAIGSVIALFASIRANDPGGGRAKWAWSLGAGVVGGLGMWVNVGVQTPIVCGIAIGGLFAAWIDRGRVGRDAAAVPASPDWRAWGLGGSLATVAACLVEYFPAHMELAQMRTLHPIYGVAWLGGGELLLHVTAWIRVGNRAWNRRSLMLAVAGLLLVAALPAVLWKTKEWGFLEPDVFSTRLTKLPDGVIVDDLWKWWIRDGMSSALVATMLPVLLLLVPLWMLFRRNTEGAARIRLAIALGPVLVTLGFAAYQLSWWSRFDAMLLVLVVAATAAIAGGSLANLPRVLWCGAFAVLILPGALRLTPARGDGTKVVLTVPEVMQLTERDLAHWLAKQAGPQGAIILAPLGETSSLCFYGGLRGLGTLDWENKDGLVGAMRIASATTETEAMELMRRRGVTHIVIPSWNPQLDDYARAGLGKIEDSFIDRLHRWQLPNWLSPVPYQFPVIPGMENRSVVILQVVDPQNDAGAMSRLAEYFLEMNQTERAVQTAESLRRFPADIGALTARAEVDIAQGDAESFATTVDLMMPRIKGVAGRFLPWDRRVSLAVVLARAKHMDESKVQTQRCLSELNEARLRSLTTGSLYRLMVLSKVHGLEITDAHLREIALKLLPPEMRGRL